MAYRRFKWMLYAFSAAVVVVALVAVAAICLSEAPRASSKSTVAVARDGAPRYSSAGAKLELSAFADIAEVQLQKPFAESVKPKLVQTQSPPPPPPRVDAVLIGTAVEGSSPDMAIAWIRYRSESTYLAIRIGDQLSVAGNPVVHSISAGEVVLDFNGNQQVLRMASEQP